MFKDGIEIWIKICGAVVCFGLQLEVKVKASASQNITNDEINLCICADEVYDKQPVTWSMSQRKKKSCYLNM